MNYFLRYSGIKKKKHKFENNSLRISFYWIGLKIGSYLHDYIIYSSFCEIFDISPRDISFILIY